MKNEKWLKAAPPRFSPLFLFFSFFILPFSFLISAFLPLEQRLLHLLPSSLLPEVSRTILLSLEKTPSPQGGYPAMDVAMALRGLGQLHPRCVVVDGIIEPENGPVPFLPTILSRMKEDSGIMLVVPQLSSPSACFQSVPLVRYSLGSNPTSWPRIEGRTLPGTGAAYLRVTKREEDQLLLLPLLATTESGASIGSLWWWALPPQARKHSPLLLFGKILLLGTHAPFLLTSAGDVKLGATVPNRPIKEIPLDDFLLQIEQKEQGTISPTFDALWNHATVVLGTPADLDQVSALATLLEQATFSRPSLWTQIVMALGWMIVFLLIKKSRSTLPDLPHWIFPLLITLLLISTTLLLLHLGIILPFLPGLLTALLLVIF